MMRKLRLLKEETVPVLHEVLKHDLRPEPVIASAFSMLNGRLAKHYAYPGGGLGGPQVPTACGQPPRADVLTYGGVLKGVTANGTSTSPSSCAGREVLTAPGNAARPRHPDGRAAVRAGIRGATPSRPAGEAPQVSSCASCHAPGSTRGFAPGKNFTVIRRRETSTPHSGNGKTVTWMAAGCHYLQGPKGTPPTKMPAAAPGTRRFRKADPGRQRTDRPRITGTGWGNMPPGRRRKQGDTAARSTARSSAPSAPGIKVADARSRGRSRAPLFRNK